MSDSGEVRVGEGEGEGGGHGVQPDVGWPARAGVKASPESGTFKRGRGEGLQGHKLPVREVVAVHLQGLKDDRGGEGHVERPELRGPEAGH
jgi:hypothetical protein